MSNSLPSPDLPTPTVPLELQFRILDHFSVGVNDDTDLQRLTFICSAWAAHIQALLFRHISLETNVACDRFILLVSDSPHLKQHVTSLSGVAFRTPELPELLPNVHTIQIRAHTFGSLPIPGVQWPTVTRLCLSFCVLSTAQDLWDLVGLFPLCKRLEFGGWMHQDMNAIVAEVSAPEMHLNHLVLKSYYNHSPQCVASWLALGDITVDRLTVELASQDDQNATAFNMLLSRVGHALKELEVTELPDAAEPVVDICLTPCDTLRSLTLYLHFSTASSHNMRVGLLFLLQRVSASTLTTLTLRLCRIPRPLDLPWVELDALLTEHQFGNLTKVVFGVSPPASSDPCPSPADFEAAIRNTMVGLQERGLLVFKHYDFY